MSDETVINVGGAAPKQDEVVTSNAAETVIPTQREADLANQSDINQQDQAKVQADTLKVQSERDAEQAKLDVAQAAEEERAAKLAQAHEEELRAQQARAMEAREHALSELDQARAKAASMKTHDFFKDASTGKKIARALLMFGGGIAQGMQNAGAAYLGQAGNFHNQVADALNAAAERDFEQQKADMETHRDAAIQAGANIGHVDAVYKQNLLDLQAGQLAAKERLLAEAKATMTKAGMPAAAIDRRLALLAEKFKMGKELENYLNDQRHLETAKFAKKKAERQTMNYAQPAGNTVDPKAIEGVVMDKSGNPLGKATSPRAAPTIAEDDAALTNSIEVLERLKKHIEEFGPNPTDKAAEDRQSLYSNAAIALTASSPAGNNEATMHHEEGSIGPSGAKPGVIGNVLGAFGLNTLQRPANPEAVGLKINELKERQSNKRKQKLTPLTPTEKAAVLRGQTPGSTAGEAAPAAGAPSVPAGGTLGKDGSMTYKGSTYVVGEKDGKRGWVRK
jgi:hypothetical protein